ncbi:MAG: SRPBCC family protein [Patescibacteria group bacterium]
MATPITVTTTMRAPIKKIWEYWNAPEHITKWAFASDTWRVPSAENDLRVGGTFKTRMESIDGLEGFDFAGKYTAVETHKHIAYTIADGRTVDITFIPEDGGTKITETFDPENENSIEMQRSGWQAILDNFKKHVEAQ